MAASVFPSLRVGRAAVRIILGSCLAAGCLAGFPLSARAGWYELSTGGSTPVEAGRARRALDGTGILKKGAEALEAVRDLDHLYIVRFEEVLGSGAGSFHTS